jgi:16S rRNA (uracil1498-N3)-methyltransferase
VNLFYQPLIPSGVRYLDPEESKHCIKVLRKKPGDEIAVTDGKGVLYLAKVTNTDSFKCEFNIVSEKTDEHRKYFIHVAISPTKNPDRVEWFVEKCVEFGIDKITLLQCERTERSHIKTERLVKIAGSAMKQSLKTFLPEITGPSNFNEVVSGIVEGEKYIASVDVANTIYLKNFAPASSTYTVLIGPEGDFSNEELAFAISKGFVKVSLGVSRLRTETAGIAACHILNLINS